MKEDFRERLFPRVGAEFDGEAKFADDEIIGLVYCIEDLQKALEDCIDALVHGSNYPESNWVVTQARLALKKKAWR